MQPLPSATYSRPTTYNAYEWPNQWLTQIYAITIRKSAADSHWVLTCTFACVKTQCNNMTVIHLI